MATTRKLYMDFELVSGDERTITLNNAKDDLIESDVSSCMNQVISAGEAFVDAPIKALYAKLVVTDTTELLDNR